MYTSQIYFGGRSAAIHGSKRSRSCMATIWWRSGDWKNYSPSIEELCCKFSIIFWPNLFWGDGDVSFLLLSVFQRVFDAVTVEGLSLLIVKGLLTGVLPNQGFLVLITLAPDCRSMSTEKDELWHFHLVTQRLPWTSSTASSMWSSLWWSLWYGCWSLESQPPNCWCSYHHKCCSSSLCLETRAKLSLKRSSSSSSCILLMLAIGAWLMEFRYLSWSSLTDLRV